MDYSNREIDGFMKDIQHNFDDVNKKLSEMHDENVKSHTILDKNQKETNGKVADIQRWRERMKGASWTLGITTTIVIIPILTWAFIAISKIPEKIDQGIKSALSVYNIEVE